VGLKQVI